MKLRALTINFWGNEPPLTRRLELLKQGASDLEVDVVGMQEVRPLDGQAGKHTAAVLAEHLGFECVYEQTLRWNDDDFFPGHPGGEEGLAVVSRFPIREHKVTRLPEARKTEARILLSACLDTPVGDTWFHTTHLHYRLDDGLARERQVLAIDDLIKETPAERPHILCGDFNAPPDSDEIRFLRGLTTLDGRRTHYQDAWLRRHPKDDGITWCSENPHTRPLRSLDIDRRIDYIFVSTRKKDGRGTVHDAQVALKTRDSEGLCASDHYGVYAEIDLGDPLLA